MTNYKAKLLDSKELNYQQVESIHFRMQKEHLGVDLHMALK